MSSSPKKFMAWNGKDYEEWFHVNSDDGGAFECSDGSYASEMGGWPGSSERQKTWVVVQYTGVNDDNGVELFEGAVVDTELGRAVIGFQHGFFCLNWLNDDGTLSGSGVELIGFDWKGRKREKLVRIGDRYCNPELVNIA